MRSYPLKDKDMPSVNSWLQLAARLENIDENSFNLSETDVHLLVDAGMQSFNSIEDIVPYRSLRRADLVQVGNGAESLIIRWNGGPEERVTTQNKGFYIRLSPRGRKLIEVCLPDIHEVIVENAYGIDKEETE